MQTQNLDSILTDYEKLQAELALLRASEHKLKEKVSHYEKEVSWLKEVLNQLRRSKFGKKSERAEVPADQLELGVFNEAEAEAQQQESQQEETEEISYTRKKKGHGGRKPLPEHLPREEVVVELPEDQRFCPHDGHPLHEIGEDVSEKLKIIPAQVSVVRTILKKYGCRQCESHVAKPEVEPVVLPQTQATAETLSWIIQSKFDQSLPLYRLEQYLGNIQVDLSRTTMARWLVQLYSLLLPIWNVLEEITLESGYMAIDATQVQVLKEKGRTAESKSSMWARGSPEHRIVLLDYDVSGGGSVAERLVEGFSGLLQSDQHKGYDRLNERAEITRLGCMAHCRRRYFSAAKDGAKSGKTLAEEGLLFIQKLYKIEEQGKPLTPSRRKKLRQTQATPILNEFKKWAQENYSKVPPRSLIGNALNYTLEQWDYLTRYKDHGQAHIDNNWLERQIRKFAIGRNNWMFSDSVEGAQASALLYSLIITAKENGKDPYKALLTILQGLPKAKSIEDYEALASHLLAKPISR